SARTAHHRPGRGKPRRRRRARPGLSPAAGAVPRAAALDRRSGDLLGARAGRIQGIRRAHPGEAAPMTAGDSATATEFVAGAPEVAFDVFTREIDLWWKSGPRFRIAGRRRGQLH